MELQGLNNPTPKRTACGRDFHESPEPVRDGAAGGKRGGGEIYSCQNDGPLRSTISTKASARVPCVGFQILRFGNIMLGTRITVFDLFNNLTLARSALRLEE